MEMAVDCTQAGAPEVALSLWANFASSMMQLPAGDDDGDDGWVQSRREQISCAKIVANRGPHMTTAEATEHAILNLNLPPGRPIGADAM